MYKFQALADNVNLAGVDPVYLTSGCWLVVSEQLTLLILPVAG